MPEPLMTGQVDTDLGAGTDVGLPPGADAPGDKDTSKPDGDVSTEDESTGLPPGSDLKPETKEDTKAEDTKTEDTKAEDAKTEDAKTEDAKTEDAKTEGAPEAYKDFDLPKELQFHQPSVEKFKAVAKELNLTQEQAQKLMGLQAEAVLGQLQDAGKALESQSTKWAEEIRADSEFGGDKLEASAMLANRALATWDPNGEVVQLLAQAKMDNHPAIFKLLVRAASTVDEDKLITTQPKGETKDVPAYMRMGYKDIGEY